MKKPNIVFILSDDHGQWAMGAYGNKDIITPNLDKLAENGVRFDNCFCASPVCSPARASLLTGKMPSAHGVHDWINGGNLSRDEIESVMVDKSLSKEQKQSKINRLITVCKHENEKIEYIKEFKTYTEILSENGYTCALSGKWHLGSVTTKQAGFKVWQPVARGGTPYMYPEVIEGDQLVIKNEFVTDYITNNALDFLDKHQDDTPFYLGIHYTCPHDPWGEEDQKPRIWDMYKDHKFPEHDDFYVHPQICRGNPKAHNSEGAKLLKRGYYSAITSMDESIGQVIDKLEEKGLAENTIVIYCSDNGMNLGQHGVWGKGNGTFPLNFYEESIKIPFILHNPLTGKRGVNTELISQCDFYPSLLSMCGIKTNLDDSFPGIDFTSEKRTEDNIVIHDEYGPNRMIRSERYKYINRYPHGPNALYDLKLDPDERINLISDAKYQKVATEMKQKLETWFTKYSDPQLSAIASGCVGLGQINTIKVGEAPLNSFETWEFY